MQFILPLLHTVLQNYTSFQLSSQDLRSQQTVFDNYHCKDEIQFCQLGRFLESAASTVLGSRLQYRHKLAHLSHSLVTTISKDVLIPVKG